MKVNETRQYQPVFILLLQDQGEGGKANVAYYHFYTGDNNIIVEEHVLADCGCIFCKNEV